MNIDAATLTRVITLAVTLINLLLSATGNAVLPIDDAQIEQAVSAVAVIVLAVINCWKNNSFTTAAQAGDKIMKAVKKGEISASVVDNVLK